MKTFRRLYAATAISLLTSVASASTLNLAGGTGLVAPGQDAGACSDAPNGGFSMLGPTPSGCRITFSLPLSAGRTIDDIVSYVIDEGGNAHSVVTLVCDEVNENYDGSYYWAQSWYDPPYNVNTGVVTKTIPVAHQLGPNEACIVQVGLADGTYLRGIKVEYH